MKEIHINGVKIPLSGVRVKHQLQVRGKNWNKTVGQRICRTQIGTE
ncbi:MAG TPA: hypothetical protein IAB74_00870 [Candidatus Faecousia excrementigallinarum]|uniref:Uncharacterized protein n=1 Tax=Candidatus Faecousia excrementigallinarum TaxID=2840806 RepID=A0A9D0Z0Z3_9FIRM|nr:hypothetical protein [Candidatus Faecousia excrementigallinarum]